ncbi:MAG TPA: GerMN domain-containing protein [bacterium]
MRAAVVGLILLAVAGLLALWWTSRPVPATAEVYFVRSQFDADTIAAVSRTVSVPRLPGIGSPRAALVRAALLEMLRGPTTVERASGFSTAIPEGTRLLGLRIADDVVYADFSGEVESGGGSASMLGRFWQIVYTATQDPLAPRVRILINGRQRQAMGGEGVIIDHPLDRPAQPPNF